MMLLGLGLGASIDEVIIVNDPYLCTLYECVILANHTSFECKGWSCLVSYASMGCVVYAWMFIVVLRGWCLNDILIACILSCWPMYTD